MLILMITIVHTLSKKYGYIPAKANRESLQIGSL